jgi:hypothetical protein
MFLKIIYLKTWLAEICEADPRVNINININPIFEFYVAYGLKTVDRDKKH